MDPRQYPYVPMPRPLSPESQIIVYDLPFDISEFELQNIFQKFGMCTISVKKYILVFMQCNKRHPVLRTTSAKIVYSREEEGII